MRANFVTEVCKAEWNWRWNSSYCMVLFNQTVQRRHFKLLVLKLFLVPKLCSDAHCMLDPEPCLVDLVYLTASVGFVLTLTPCGNKDFIWYDVILSVLKLGLDEVKVPGSNSFPLSFLTVMKKWAWRLFSFSREISSIGLTVSHLWSCSRESKH